MLIFNLSSFLILFSYSFFDTSTPCHYSVNKSIVCGDNVVVKQSKIKSLLVHWAKITPYGLFLNLLIDRLALWQKVAMADAPHIAEHDQHDFDFGLWLSLFSVSSTSETSSDYFSGWFPYPVNSDVLTKQVWSILETVDDVLTHLYAALVLTIIQLCLHLYVQTFSIPKTSVIIIQKLFSTPADLWLFKHSTANRYTPPALIARFSHCLLRAFNWWRYLSPLHTSQRSSCHSKTDGVICRSISSPCDGVFLKWAQKFRFIHCPVFFIHFSTLIAEWYRK